MITEINNNLLYGWTLGWTPSIGALAAAGGRGGAREGATLNQVLVGSARIARGSGEAEQETGGSRHP